MKFEVNIEKKYALSLIASILVLAVAMGAFAYGTNNPQVFGHSAGEISGVQIAISGSCPNGISSIAADGKANCVSTSTSTSAIKVVSTTQITLEKSAGEIKDSVQYNNVGDNVDLSVRLVACEGPYAGDISLEDRTYNCEFLVGGSDVTNLNNYLSITAKWNNPTIAVMCDSITSPMSGQIKFVCPSSLGKNDAVRLHLTSKN